jgi:hypothetical protein
MKVEYRVRPVTRYFVTRWYDSGNTGGTECKGEFDNWQNAYAVAYALCKDEHERLGYPIGDMRIKYPELPEASESLKQEDPQLYKPY